MRKHPITQARILALPAGRYYYGDGLVLVVKAGKRRISHKWVYRYTNPSTKTATETSIGSVQAFTYPEARNESVRLQGLVARGHDPVQVKREQRAAQTTFAEACDGWIENNQASWSESHRHSVDVQLKQHGKVLLTKAVSSIDADIVEEAIKPLWLKAPNQARRALAMWARVFAYAKQKKMHSGDNPAEWKNNLDCVFPKQGKNDKGHFSSLPYAELQDFIHRLHVRQNRGTASIALEFTILTATRSGETMGAVWSEFDLENKIWIIPAERMKTKEKHRVPLCGRAMELLARQKEWQREYIGGNSEFVFQGRDGKTRMDEKSMRVILGNMDVPVTVHGFRATFKSWATEQTEFSWEVIELCLAHKVGTAVARAYLRGDALEKRREIMEEWALFCSS
jgi:integrase